MGDTFMEIFLYFHLSVSPQGIKDVYFPKYFPISDKKVKPMLFYHQHKSTPADLTALITKWPAAES